MACYCTTVILLTILLTAAGNDFVSSNKGNDFCIGFMHTVFKNDFYIIVSSSSDTSVDITIELDTSVFIRQASTSRPYRLYLYNTNTDVRDSSYEYRNFGICVTSNSLISVSAFLSIFDISSSSYLALPYQEILDDQYEYYTLSVSSTNVEYLSGFLLVAFKLNTSITIYPSIPLSIPQDTQDQTSTNIMVLPGENHTVILHRRQTLYIGKDGGADITGTRIVSDKPLTVISGHEAGSAHNGTLEPMAQQIPPTQLWGNRFMIAPFNASTEGSVIKILAAKDNTRIQYECGGISNVLFITAKGDNDQFIVPVNDHCYIEANDSVLVGQFRYSTGVDVGDTVMILVPSIDQYSNDILFSTHNTTATIGNTINHYITIIVPVEYYKPNAIYYDDTPIDSEWAPIYYNNQIKGYGCSFEITPTLKQHRVHCIDTEAYFFVIAYGLSISRAYGYPVGLIMPTAKIIGFEWPSEGILISEFQGLLNYKAIAVRSIGQDITFTYSTISIYGVTIGVDYTNVNEEIIVYHAGEEYFDFNVEIHDDDVTEENEALRINVCTEFQTQELCFGLLITIVDNDIMTIGLIEVISNYDHILSIVVAVSSGQLEPQYKVHLKLNITLVAQNELFVNVLEFTSYVKSHSIDFSVPNVQNDTLVMAALSAVDSTQSLQLLIQPDERVVSIFNSNTASTTIEPSTTNGGGTGTTSTTSGTSTSTTSTISNGGGTGTTNGGVTKPTTTQIDSTNESTPSGIHSNYVMVIALPLACVFIAVTITTIVVSTVYCIVKNRKQRGTASLNQQRQDDLTDGTLNERITPLLQLVKPHRNISIDSRGTRGQYRGVPLHLAISLPAYDECRHDETIVTAEQKEESTVFEEEETRFDGGSEDEEYIAAENGSMSSDGYESTTSQ